MAQGKTHLVVICDTFDYDDYPSFASSADEARRMFEDHSNMKRPMEVYKLSDPKEDQLNERRCARY